MLKTYSESILIRTSNCDLMGKWRLGDILATLQEVSGMHSHLLGCGRDVMMKQNIIWVLSRSELVMDRYPIVGETIRIETFPANNKRWFFPRYFLMYDEAGEIIGKMCMIWVLMDYVERKMAPPEAALPFLPDNSDLALPMPFPGNVAPVNGETELFHRLPDYTDIDVNQHVNNTRYADWLCNGLGIDTLREKEISHLLIHYTHEVLPGSEMTLTLHRSENAFRMTGEHNQNKHFDIGGELRAR